MKKYRLKQWYPSLDVALNVGDVIEITGRVESFYGGIIYEFTHTTGDYTGVGFIQECEFNNPDFWELIEEGNPLFVTEDGVEIFSKEAVIYIVNKNFYKKETELCNIYDKSNREDFKYFFHESNADEYIWRNMRVFSYEEIAKRASQTELYYLETLAKERIEG